MVTIRPEQKEDKAAIRAVNNAAFGRPGEGQLVDLLRTAGAITLSLVAEKAGRVVGHILFSPARIEGANRAVDVIALGPVAVLPERQGQGIGGQLIRAGLEQLKAAGHDAVILIGHPTYYPRFGFVPAPPLGLACEFDVPDEVFMVYEFRPGSLEGIRGTAYFHDAFRAVT